MPHVPQIVPNDNDTKPTFRVLITGFGPFSQYSVNPSWLAVKELQNVILQTESSSKPITVADQAVLSEYPPPASSTSNANKPIHVTVLKVPVVYDSVLSIVPKLHARPPVLPHSSSEWFDELGIGDDEDENPDGPPPPEEGYDLIVHVGVAGPGSLRAEKLAHKLGYNIPDAAGKLAPEANPGEKDENEGGDDEAEKLEKLRSGFMGKGAVVRGFAEGYEAFDTTLQTRIDVDKLVEHLHAVGVDEIKPSLNAGRYLCDFIYYCSLAESLRTQQANKQGSKNTEVLFIHCPPVEKPLSTQYVTDALKHIVSWVCGEL